MTDSNPDALNADSASLLKQAMWCGVVCALAAVLTALNMYPPVRVQYKVSTRVVVSQTRLDQLRSVLERDRKIIASGRLRYVQLLNLKLLDEVKNDGLLLVELDSLWTGRASPTHMAAWLATVSNAEPRMLVNSIEAREKRISLWQADTAKHYLKHHLYLGSIDKAVAPAATTPVQLTSTISTPNDRVPATFANLHTPPDQGASVSAPQPLEPTAGVEGALADRVKQAEDVAKKSEELFTHALEKHAGAIEVVGNPRIRSKTNSIPTWMSASVLILAFATGALASRTQYRVQSGGAYDPRSVSDQLASDGLPVLALVQLAPLGHESSHRSTPTGMLSTLMNTTSQHLARAGEGLLMIWCFAIACRILFDPMWRSVAIESPLAAFGRLVAGMP